MVSPNSMGVRKCGGNLQATRGLWYLHSFLHHWTCVYLLSTSFIRRILPNSGLSEVRFEPLFIGWVSPHGVMNIQALRLLEKKNTSLVGSDEKISYPSHLLKWSRSREYKRLHNHTWCAGSLKDSVVSTRVHMDY